MGGGSKAASKFEGFRGFVKVIGLTCIAVQLHLGESFCSQGWLISEVMVGANEHAPPPSNGPKGAETWLLGGRADLRAGRFPEAEKDFRQALTLAPNSARVHAAILKSYSEANHLSSAKELFVRESEKAPDNPLYALDLVEVGLLTGDIAQVCQALTAAAQRFPGDGKMHAQLGKMLFDRNQENTDDLALAEFLREQQTGFRDSESSLSLASLESIAGAQSDAIENALWVEKRMDVEPSRRAAAAAVAGEGSAGKGAASKAIEQLTKAIELAPNVEDYYLRLARVRSSNKDYRGAAVVLEQGRRVIPESTDIGLNLGTNLSAAADYRRAIDVLAELITRFPNTFQAYVQLADNYRMVGELKRASEVLHKLAVLQPQFPMIHIMYAQALHEAGAPYDAVFEELDKAEKASPSDPDVFYLRGKINLQMGRYQDALEALTRATQLQPTSPDFYYQLGLAYQRLGKQAEAQEQFNRKIYLEQTASKP
jgi:tetratricopeptide (TPR) repeat protein